MKSYFIFSYAGAFALTTVAVADIELRDVTRAKSGDVRASTLFWDDRTDEINLGRCVPTPLVKECTRHFKQIQIAKKMSYRAYFTSIAKDLALDVKLALRKDSLEFTSQNLELAKEQGDGSAVAQLEKVFTLLQKMDGTRKFTKDGEDLTIISSKQQYEDALRPFDGIVDELVDPKEVSDESHAVEHYVESLRTSFALLEEKQTRGNATAACKGGDLVTTTDITTYGFDRWFFISPLYASMKQVARKDGAVEFWLSDLVLDEKYQQFSGNRERNWTFYSAAYASNGLAATEHLISLTESPFEVVNAIPQGYRAVQEVEAKRLPSYAASQIPGKMPVLCRFAPK